VLSTLGLATPQQPLTVLAIATAFPAIYVQALRALENYALEDPTTGSAGALGTKIKAYGCPFFLLGHYLLTKGKERDFMDFSYFTACGFLSAAFMGTHVKKPFPEGIPATGIFLVIFGWLARGKMLAAGAPATLGYIAMAAGATLVYLGAQMMAKKWKLLEEALPGLSFPQLAQLASVLFGIANFTAWFKMVQAGAPWADARYGQLIKICASSSLMTGNALGLGWQKVKIPGDQGLSMLGLVAAASLAMPASTA